jgi:radical SAM protein with 4Fe4S-binding SPASM domain
LKATHRESNAETPQIMNVLFAIKALMLRALPAEIIRRIFRVWRGFLSLLPLSAQQKYRGYKWDRDFDREHFPINVIAIETIGECNRDCAYCPVSLVDKRRGRMSKETFESIVLQLKKLDYQGEIYLHFYNEPLLDKRVIGFLRFIREHLKDNMLKLFTNGDPLTLQKARDIIDAGVTALAISMHDAETEEKADKIIAGLPLEMREKIETNRYYDIENHIYTNRAGSIVSDDFEVRRAASVEGCDKTEFIIDYKGSVHPCSEDIGQGYVLGNVNENTLLEIWQNGRSRFRDHFTGNFCAICRQCVGLDRAPDIRGRDSATIGV